MSLTPIQIQEMNDAYNAAKYANDPSIYYQELSEKGFAYGDLALGVVEDNTLIGITAINYAENKLVNDLGSTFTAQDRQNVMMELMDQDFNARTSAGWNDIPESSISTYHNDTFTNQYPSVARAPEAWTDYNVVRVLGSDNNVIVDNAGATFIYFQMIETQLFGNVQGPSYGNAFDWVQDMRIGLVLDKRDWSWHAGDGVLAGSLKEFGGVGVDYVHDLFQHAAAEDNGFYSNGLETLLTDIAYQYGVGSDAVASGFTTNGTSGLSIDVSGAQSYASPGSEWLDETKLGAKWSIVGGDLNAQIWGDIGTSTGDSAALLQRVDAYAPEAVLFASGAAAAGSDDTLMLSGGADLTGGAGDDMLIGNNASEVMTGGAGTDQIFAAAGDDIIVRADGDDVAFGGDGNDTLTYASANSGIAAMLASDEDFGWMANIENVSYTDQAYQIERLYTSLNARPERSWGSSKD